jgi:hypothetical protein
MIIIYYNVTLCDSLIAPQAKLLRSMKHEAVLVRDAKSAPDILSHCAVRARNSGVHLPGIGLAIGCGIGCGLVQSSDWVGLRMFNALTCTDSVQNDRLAAALLKFAYFAYPRYSMILWLSIQCLCASSSQVLLASCYDSELTKKIENDLLGQWVEAPESKIQHSWIFFDIYGFCLSCPCHHVAPMKWIRWRAQLMVPLRSRLGIVDHWYRSHSVSRWSWYVACVRLILSFKKSCFKNWL